MPLYIDLAVNEKTINRFFITRLEGQSLDPDTVNTYSIVAREDLKDGLGDKWTPSWGDYLNGDHFTHRYGDGASMCLFHGLNAWHQNGKKLA